MLPRMTLALMITMALCGQAMAEGAVTGMLFHSYKTVQVVSPERFITVTEVTSASGNKVEYLQSWSLKPDGSLLCVDSVDLTTPQNKTNRVQVTHHSRIDISPEK